MLCSCLLRKLEFAIYKVLITQTEERAQGAATRGSPCDSSFSQSSICTQIFLRPRLTLCIRSTGPWSLIFACTLTAPSVAIIVQTFCCYILCRLL